jgi:8-oxo-dGTP pyrophosphatase MutT (NUDIX family)
MKKLPTFGPMKTVFSGNIFHIKRRPVTFPDGTSMEYEYCERPASVSILAFSDKNELLMIKEYRHGYRKDVWFLPSGRVDHPGDTPRKAAIRELREEGGYRPKTIQLIHKKSPSNTLLWDIYIFAAKDLVLDPLPGDKEEQIEPVFVPFKKAVQMAKDGTILDEFISYNIIRFDHMMKHGQFRFK